MNTPEWALCPPAALLAKIGSIVVHADEMLSMDGHEFDRHALQSLLADPEIQAWLKEMGKLAMIPVKRMSGERVKRVDRILTEIAIRKSRTKRGTKTR